MISRFEPQHSPAVRAVLNAYRDASWTPDKKDNGRYYKYSHYAAMAAALRAAADEVISSTPPPCADFDEYAQGFLAAHVKYRNEILAIAAELEGAID